MNLFEAKHKFEIVCCRWYYLELLAEIENSLPNLRSFKSGYGWQLFSFLHSLPFDRQKSFASALVKRNPNYLSAVGEKVTPEEIELWQMFEKYLQMPAKPEVELQLAKDAGKKIKMASKSKLREKAVAKFIQSFGSQCHDMKISSEWDPLFHTKILGWDISTQLTFGRKHALLDFRHIVVSETRIPHPQYPSITGPAMMLHPGVSWVVDQWVDILDCDIDEVCEHFIKIVRRFFDAAPNLLKGFEFEKVTL